MLPLLLCEPLKERSIAAYIHAIDAAATLLLAVVMLWAPVAGAGRSRCHIGPKCSHGVQPCVPVHLICLCTRPYRAPLYYSTSNVRTRDYLSVVLRSGYCCFCTVAMRLIVAAICTAGTWQRYPVIARTAAHDTSCTIPTCAVRMMLFLYGIDVRVMSVRTFIFLLVDVEKKKLTIKIK